MFIANLVLIYLLQVLLACIINLDVGTRIPTSLFDFIKLTFFPYVLYQRIKDKSKLTD